MLFIETCFNELQVFGRQYSVYRVRDPLFFFLINRKTVHKSIHPLSGPTPALSAFILQLDKPPKARPVARIVSGGAEPPKMDFLDPKHRRVQDLLLRGAE